MAGIKEIINKTKNKDHLGFTGKFMGWYTCQHMPHIQWAWICSSCNHSWCISKSRPFTILPGLHFVLALFPKCFLTMNLSLISRVMMSNGGDFPQLSPPKKGSGWQNFLFLQAHFSLLNTARDIQLCPIQKYLQKSVGTLEGRMWIFLVWGGYDFPKSYLLCYSFEKPQENCQIESKHAHGLKFNLFIDICLPLRFSISLLRSQVVWPNFTVLKAPLMLLHTVIFGW